MHFDKFSFGTLQIDGTTYEQGKRHSPRDLLRSPHRYSHLFRTDSLEFYRYHAVLFPTCGMGNRLSHAPSHKIARCQARASHAQPLRKRQRHATPLSGRRLDSRAR